MEVPKNIYRKSPVRFVTAGHQYHVRVWDYETSTCLYGEKFGDVVSTECSDDSESYSTHFLSHLHQIDKENILVASSTDGRIFYLDLQESQRKIIVRSEIIGKIDEIIDARFFLLDPPTRKCYTEKAKSPNHVAILS